MTFTDSSHELDAILRHGTAYELIDFLARLQVVVAAHMVQEHAEQQMVERALDNEKEYDDEAKFKKLGQKRAMKKRHTRVELPELNTALVEVYKEARRQAKVCHQIVASIRTPHGRTRGTTPDKRRVYFVGLATSYLQPLGDFDTNWTCQPLQ